MDGTLLRSVNTWVSHEPVRRLLVGLRMLFFRSNEIQTSTTRICTQYLQSSDEIHLNISKSSFNLIKVNY